MAQGVHHRPHARHRRTGVRPDDARYAAHAAPPIHSCVMESPSEVTPNVPPGPSWIDALTDEQCKEIFWLYVEEPDRFLNAYPAPLLGAAMRYALRVILAEDRS